MYIREPALYKQQDLFAEEEISYAYPDFPLFFDTLIRWQFYENIYFLTSPDLSYVIISGFGVSLSKKSERLVIKNQGKFITEIPFFRIKNIAILSKGVSLSSDLIEHCCKYSIAISFHDFSAKPIALLQSIYGPTHGKVKMLQIEALSNSKSISLIERIIAGKISNQIAILKYSTKNLYKDENNEAKLLQVQKSCINMAKYQSKALHFDTNSDLEKARIALMGYEGVAARSYWEAIGKLLEEKVTFTGREYKKIPKDAVNCLLNYGYGILYAKIWKSIILAGLDPYIGFLHSEKSGQPALVFDLIEEFRAPLIDRVVIAFIMLNRPIEIEHGLLSLQTRKIFSQKILERLTSREYYEGEKIIVEDIILSQAKRLSSYLEGKIPHYKPFSYKW